MTITPKQNVTINGLTYHADTTYQVTYTIFTKMVVAGAMKSPSYTSTSTADVVVVDDQVNEKKPVRKSSRRRTIKK